MFETLQLKTEIAGLDKKERPNYMLPTINTLY